MGCHWKDNTATSAVYRPHIDTGLGKEEGGLLDLGGLRGLFLLCGENVIDGDMFWVLMCIHLFVSYEFTVQYLKDSWQDKEHLLISGRC